jgi:hypothetical protein
LRLEQQVAALRSENYELRRRLRPVTKPSPSHGCHGPQGRPLKLRPSPPAPARPLPRGRHVIQFLASRPEFAGVAPVTAARLWETFGEELYRVLGAGAGDRLATLLPRTQAEIVCDAWRNQLAVADAVVFFDGIGIDVRLARKAVDFWGE